MYSYYFPKDVASGGGRFTSIIVKEAGGHKHDFEGVIVWTDSCDVNTAKMVALSYSSHGGYLSYPVNQEIDPDVHREDGKYRPEAEYSYGGQEMSTHSMHKNGGVNALGKNHIDATLIQWKNMPKAAQTSLARSWGSANCMVCDAKFEDQLKRAWNGHDSLKGLGGMLNLSKPAA